MATEMKLWQVHEGFPQPVESEDKVDYEILLEDWLQQDIALIDEQLLVIGRQVPTRENHKIDLLALDQSGNTVVLKLKREMADRDAVAQVFDYVSWIDELGQGDIEEIAEEFFRKYLEKDDTSLEAAFSEKFGEGLPEFVNAEHRMYIVAPSYDQTTERIVAYLSGTHGIEINIATFAYYKIGGIELVGRSMLLDEDVVQTRASSKGGSKQKPRLKLEELTDIAEANGVIDLWRTLYDALMGVPSRNPYRDGNGIHFRIRTPNGRLGQFVSLFPIRSSSDHGLAVRVNHKRVSEYCGVTEETIRELCGEPARETFGMTHFQDDNAHFFTAQRLDQFIRILRDESSSEGVPEDSAQINVDGQDI